MTVHTLDEVTSTNDVARKALLAGDAAGTAFRADRQTAGRGRMGRSWLSHTGDLFMSVLLRPRVEPGDLPTITLAAAVGVRRALADCGVRAGLKWPNDLVLQGRKLGGILVEGVFDAERLVGCIVGVGINVALDVDALDEPLRATATSFRHAGADPPSLDDLAERVRQGVIHEIARVESGEVAGVLDDWRTHGTTLGLRVSYAREGAQRTGRAVDLDARGALVVDEDGGGRVTILSGEVAVAIPLS